MECPFKDIHQHFERINSAEYLFSNRCTRRMHNRPLLPSVFNNPGIVYPLAREVVVSSRKWPSIEDRLNTPAQTALVS